MNKKIFMWLSIPVVILVIVFVIIMVIHKDNSINTVKENTISNNEANDNENLEYNKEWGVTQKITASNKKSSESWYINFPYNHTGSYSGTGVIAAQNDGSLVIADGQNKLTSPEIESIQTFFPAYFEQAYTILDGYYRMRGDNYSFEIESQDTITINGYEMCKYMGKHTFNYEREPRSCKWVAYVTQLKSNGAYVYWIVLENFHLNDNEQSLDKTIEEHAYKMACSLREELK